MYGPTKAGSVESIAQLYVSRRGLAAPLIPVTLGLKPDGKVGQLSVVQRRGSTCIARADERCAVIEPTQLPKGREDHVLRTDDALASFARLLRRRWLVGAVAFCLVIATTVITTLHHKKSYTAEVKLIARSGQNELLMPDDSPVETYIELLTERPIAESVVRNLRINVGPDALLTHVVVRPVGPTRVLDLAVTWKDPETAALIANGFADALVGRQHDVVSGRSEDLVTTVSSQLPSARARERRAALDLVQFEHDSAARGLANSSQQLVEMLDSVDAKINDAALAGREAQQEAALVEKEAASARNSVVASRVYGPSTELTQLRSQLASVNDQRNAALGKYRADHPQLQQLTREAERIEAQIKKSPAQSLESEHVVDSGLTDTLTKERAGFLEVAASADVRLSDLHRQRERLLGQFLSIPERAERYANLKRDAALAADLLTALERKRDGGVVAQTSAVGDVSVVAPAVASDAAVKPDLHTNLQSAFIVGAALAVIAMLAFDFFDDSLRDERDLAAAGIGLPVLATVRKDRSKIAALADAFAQLVPALRADSERRVITILSSRNGDGQSRIALELARTLGLIDPDILIVDGNFRSPTLHEMLLLPRGQGLTDMLVGVSTFDSVVRRNVAPGLDALTCGTSVPNPLALLQNSHFERFLFDAKTRYRTIIIDAPPLESVFDGAVIASRSDTCLFVAGTQRTQGRLIRDALRRLSAAGVKNCAGLIFTEVKWSPPKEPLMLPEGVSS
jgi:succinoglycan biosynthesis transport protein ExoP